ncbi:HNH endonuclease [Neobacillus piezotolerans]|uniref:HNH endonuclease n=1 Tax=Neobacillus piezotolerans TaxID=2259171 RepID=A0A3D8GWU7_9BACI|nr:HNH endonuclease signature motif containing protein [Neobacillus piezotolerans]RDU38913.1 HNH endonuclease [Neobacillus piezotolerans]
MNIKEYNKEDFWRAVILYGLNQATYKIALGESLIRFSEKGKNFISMNELAEDFFNMYLDRLKNGKPQLANPNRKTAMERIISLYNLNKLSKTQAIERVEREAFNDVIERFHTVDKVEIPLKFYEKTKEGLVILDNIYEVFSDAKNFELKQELKSRWDLLESAFEIKHGESELINDIRKFYLLKGYERTDITHNRSVLYGYQNGVCFYCAELMMEKDIHVDHVIPRQLIHNDEVWNLVLSHGYCNTSKSDYLPNKNYILKLIERNEYLIKSNHPISNKLKLQLGNTPKHRMSFVFKVYEDAQKVLAPWTGINGYNPVTDPFYKTFVRELIYNNT